MSMPIRWCCLAFKNNFEFEAGARGVYVAAVRREDDRFYELVHRAIDARHQAAAREISFAFPLSLEQHLAIRYCPWCAADLARHYESQLDLPRRDLEPL